MGEILREAQQPRSDLDVSRDCRLEGCGRGGQQGGEPRDGITGGRKAVLMRSRMRSTSAWAAARPFADIQAG
jgi:hypothetical protein